MANDLERPAPTTTGAATHPQAPSAAASSITWQLSTPAGGATTNGMQRAASLPLLGPGGVDEAPYLYAGSSIAAPEALRPSGEFCMRLVSA
jgi:hypothetical protein